MKKNKSETKIFKYVGKYEAPYVMMERKNIQLNTISFKATGLYAYFCSLPNDWSVYLEKLVQAKTDGRTSVESGLKELVEAGFMYIKRGRNEKGHYTTNYYFFEYPEWKEEFLKENGIVEEKKETKETKEEKETSEPKVKTKEKKKVKAILNDNFKKRLSNIDDSKEVLEMVKEDQTIFNELSVLFNLNSRGVRQRKRLYTNGEAPPSEVAKIYVKLLKVLNRKPNEREIEIVDGLLIKGFKAKPIIETIEHCEKKYVPLFSQAFLEILSLKQDMNNEMRESYKEIIGRYEILMEFNDFSRDIQEG